MKHLFSFFSLSTVRIENYCDCQTSLCYVVREPLCFSIFPILSLFIFNRLQYLDLRRVFYSEVFFSFWKITSHSSLYDRSMKFYRLCSLLQNKVSSNMKGGWTSSNFYEKQSVTGNNRSESKFFYYNNTILVELGKLGTFE